MKKIKIVLLIFVVSAIAISCGNQSLEKVNDFEPKYNNSERRHELAEIAVIGNYILTENEVSSSLLSFLSSKNTTENRAAVAERYKIALIDSEKISLPNVNLPKNRSVSIKEYDDTTFYLYQYSDNYTEEAGYALLSNDRRIGEILAVLDDNSDFNEDISDSPFMQFFCMNLENYVEQTSEIWNSLTDDDLIKARSSISDIVSSKKYNYSIIGYNYGNISNLLTTKWDQSNPYNSAISSIKGAEYPTGCTATAMCQIMAFYEYPKICTGTIKNELNKNWGPASNWDGNYDWKIMKSMPKAKNLSSTGRMMVGSLMYQIAEELESNYGSNGTGVAIEKNAPYLRRLGYQCDEFASYSFDLAKKSIDNGCPVFIVGWSTKILKEHKFLWWHWETVERYSDGHTWVIDGYYNMKCTATNRNDSTDIQTFTTDFVHCNIGWGGAKDGYYADRIFATTRGPVVEEVKIEPDARSTVKFGGFIYNLIMITNIQPKKS